MHRPRVIPVLLLQNGALVKSRQFREHRYIGDPLNAVSLFNALKADELIFLDISASPEQRSIETRLVQEIGAEANMPFSVGGGLRSLDAIRAALAAGAEKVVLGTSVMQRPEFIREAAEEFGSSTIAICLDVLNGQVHYRQSPAQPRDPMEFARLAEHLGAGEIVLQSVGLDGLMQGYDLALTASISQNLGIPVVALGGAGHSQHLCQAYQECGVSGVAAGSLFVYHGSKNGVLINYPSRRTIHNWFRPRTEVAG